MKARVLLVLFILGYVSAQFDKKYPPARADFFSRSKRNAVGALHIVTNHAQPIHADVKPDAEGSEKPCPQGSRPSHIEPGAGFQVTPPEEGKYEVKSLRKSLPLHEDAVHSNNTGNSPQKVNHTKPPTTMEFVRSASRAVTLLVLFVTAVLEFYSVFASSIRTIYNYMK